MSSFESTPVSPIETFSLDERSLDSSYGTHSTTPRRWSESTQTTPTYTEKPVDWEAPPVPPIPADAAQEAWRRRSLKRSSCTSQMSNGTAWSAQRAALAGVDIKERLPMHPLPVHIASTLSASPTSGPVRRPRAQTDLATLDDLHWEVAGANPRNWATGQKWFHTFAAGSTSFVCYFASSTNAPIHLSHTSPPSHPALLSSLPIALYVIGLACGWPFSRPLAMLLGRKLACIFALTALALLTVGTAFAQSLTAVLVCRCLAGVTASPALSIAMLMLLDLWSPETRTRPLFLYTFISILGLLLGPLVAAYADQLGGARWTQYSILIAFALCLPLNLGTKADREVASLQLSSKRKDVTKGNLQPDVMSAIRTLFTEPVLLLSSLYAGSLLGNLYVFFTQSPIILAKSHHFNVGSQGAIFTSMIVGLALASLAAVLIDRSIYRPRAAKWSAQQCMEARKARKARSFVSGSRTSLARTMEKRRSSISMHSRPGYLRGASTTSLILKRPASGGDLRATAQWERNASLAIAAAAYVNSLQANEGKRIMPERILLLLNQHLTFSDLCTQLEAYELRIDRAELARALTDALASAPPSRAGDPEKPASFHTAAAAAALEAPAPYFPPLPPPPPPVMTPTTVHRPSSSQTLPAADYLKLKPPAEWRLWPALPGSLLSATSLFLFAWTASSARIPWIVPVLAMGMFAFGAVLVLVSLTEYVWDSFSEKQTASAMAGSPALHCMLAGVFPILAVPLHEKLGAAWATSVFGFVALGLGLVPWVFLFNGKRWRERRVLRGR